MKRGRTFCSCLVAAALAAIATAADAQAPTEACANLLPDQHGAQSAQTLSIDGLVRIRDIGSPDSALLFEPSPLAVSPQGDQIAFVISRAEPATNSFCRGLVLLDGTTNGTVKLVDTGGEFVKNPPLSIRGLITPSGFPATIVPKWSSDGREVVYLKRLNGSTQVWRVKMDGSLATQVSHLSSDVEDVAWLPDGHNIVVKSRPAIRVAEREIAARAVEGYRYDDAFVPGSTNHPRVRGPIDPQYLRINIDTGAEIAAGKSEQAILDPGVGPRVTGASATNANGDIVWSQAKPQSFWGPYSVAVKYRNGLTRSCADSACGKNLVGLWWAPSADEVWFERTEGWGGERIAFYVWRPRSGNPPRRTISTTDAISGCQPFAGGLICTRDSASNPRRLARIDPHSGELHDIFRSNPEFGAMPLGEVKRLRWTNKYGFKAFGDLVLPVGYKAGQRYPLIVVQYLNRGFLRGGTGDEFPIFLFAQRGFAVLAVNRTDFWGKVKGGNRIKSPEDEQRFDVVNWMDRRSLASSIEEAVKLTVRMGVTDPRRVGLTGLSDGSTTAQFLAINSRMFSVASLAACCMEPVSAMIYGGQAWSTQLRQFGYPSFVKKSDKFWAPISFAVSASRLTMPTLFNESDDEYLIALPAYEAVRQKGLAAEFYVYPDEHHIIWQSAHRRAIYGRNLAWFEFWLNHVEDRCVASKDDLSRWEKLPGAPIIRTVATANFSFC